MEDRVLQFRVGVVVVAAVIITGILVMLFGEMPTLVGGTYTVYVKFREAPGVTVDTPVRKSGILIGRVTDVELLDDGGVLVTTEIDNKYKLRENEVCRIGAGTLLGDAVLEFVPSGVEGAPNETISDGDYQEGVVAANPLEVFTNLEDEVTQALLSVRDAGTEVNRMARNLNAIVQNNREPLTRIVRRAEVSLGYFEDAMQTIDKTAKTVEDLLGDEELKDDLKTALKDIPELIKEAKKTMNGIERTMAKAEGVMASAERNLTNIEGLTKPLGDRGGEIVTTVVKSLARLEELLDELSDFGKQLNNENGTLGRLVRDPELYQQLNRAAHNIEVGTRDIDRIMKDVRVFTDKIARNPSVLGLQGALNKRRTGLKSLPGVGREPLGTPSHILPPINEQYQPPPR